VATVLWIIAGGDALEVAHDLQVYEERCEQEGIFNHEEIWKRIVKGEEHKQINKKIIRTFGLFLLAIIALIGANWLTKS
jgi:superoxide dismutase